MRTLPSFVTICLLGTAIAALLPACSSTDDPPTPPGTAGATGTAGAAGTAGAGTAGANAGDPAKGAIVWKAQECGACHGANAEGLYGPNITYSVTAGIGSWTAAQFRAAVREGKDTDGTALCPTMERYTAAEINDAQMDDLFAHLKSLPVSDVMSTGQLLCP